MGLFRRPVEAAPEPVEERSWAMAQLGRYISDFVSPTTGRYLSVDESLRWSAAWACVRVLGQSASSLPMDVVRYVDGARQPVSPTPSLIAEPSAMVESDVWVYQLIESMESDGNAWGVITATDGVGRPTQIETVDPTVVTERKYENGTVSARVDGKVMRRYPDGELWHVPGIFVRAGSPFGLSTVAYAAGAIDAALAAEQFGARFFTDGGHPSSIISSEADLTETQAKAIKNAFVAATSGNREPAVMGAGLRYQAVQINPDDSQFIDLLRLEVENTCRFFGVPPSMVYGTVSGQSVTYANVSQADLHYLKHSLDGRLVRLERALTRLLPRPQVVKFNRDALLRADTATRYAAHAVALQNKWRSVNEVRRIEDEEPFEGDEFNEPGVPGGAAPAEPIPTEQMP